MLRGGIWALTLAECIKKSPHIYMSILTAPEDFFPHMKKFMRKPPPHMMAGYRQLVYK